MLPSLYWKSSHEIHLLTSQYFIGLPLLLITDPSICYGSPAQKSYLLVYLTYIKKSNDACYMNGIPRLMASNNYNIVRFILFVLPQ